MMVYAKRVFRKIRRIFREIKRVLILILTLNGLKHDLFGKFYCSVCQRAVVNFRPLSKSYFKCFRKYGYKLGNPETCNVDQYACPRCDSSDRDRLYAIYLSQFLVRQAKTNLKTAFSILDFAPNPVLSCLIKSKFSDRPGFCYRTADIRRDGVDDQVDIMNMEIYRTAQFAFFICSHILEHVEDDRQALRELFRITKDGGGGILMVPIDLSFSGIDEDPACTDEAIRWGRFGQGDHVRKYSKQGFIDRVSEAGFIVHQFGCEVLGTEQFIKNGITQQSILYVVEKPIKSSIGQKNVTVKSHSNAFSSC